MHAQCGNRADRQECFSVGDKNSCVAIMRMIILIKRKDMIELAVTPILLIVAIIATIPEFLIAHVHINLVSSFL
jgi:hypothetical protein